MAEITNLPAVVIAPGVAKDRVRALHTVQVSADQVLIVVITEGGRVVQQRGRVRVPITPQEVEEAQGMMASAVVGKELGATISRFGDRIAESSEPIREAALTISDCLHLAASSRTEMFVGGTQRMAEVWEDLTSFQRILDILEREAEVMKLLAGASGTSIQLGSELDSSEVDLAVVSKTYDASGEGGGSVGVIGPMRMNYKRAISALKRSLGNLNPRSCRARTEMAKDYYAILGVSREAPTEEIKKSFRRIARETHPDTNPDDSAAEARFRDAAEAYEVLSDPERRARHNRGDTIDLTDLFNGLGGIDDLLRSVFGESGLFGSRQRTVRGRDVLVRTEVSLEEAAFGGEAIVEYQALGSWSIAQGLGRNLEPQESPVPTVEERGGCGWRNGPYSAQ